ncbi:MAG: PTS sugar transporter subunit IIA [Deltaproteobacteria bacterium]|nr:PTS sugar transporter subunit IIA [Deltaproteobacteria bacterium]
MGEGGRKVIGIIVAAHQDLGPALLRAAEGIVGVMERAEALSLNYAEDPDVARGRFAEALKRVGEDGEVLILTDMFGGTPTNMSLPFLEPGRIEVVTGINLPMLLKAQSARREMGLKELASFLREYGAKNIVVAGELLHAQSRGAG